MSLKPVLQEGTMSDVTEIKEVENLGNVRVPRKAICLG